MKLQVPDNYQRPRFPGLYWPFPVRYDLDRRHLYYIPDVWRFTLIWTLTFFLSIHLAASVLAVCVNGRRKHYSKVVWMIPAIYLVVGGVEGFFAGSTVGVLVGALYHVGALPVSTWIPFVLALINTLALILSSFSISGAI